MCLDSVEFKRGDKNISYINALYNKNENPFCIDAFDFLNSSWIVIKKKLLKNL